METDIMIDGTPVTVEIDKSMSRQEIEIFARVKLWKLLPKKHKEKIFKIGCAS